MLVSDLMLDERVKKIYSEEGFAELYPPQEAAVSSGLLEAGNMILSTPTASGKTFTAELALAKTLSTGKKCIYIVPLRALAYEKYTEFKKYEKLGYTVRLEVGDLDSKKHSHKPRFDILVATAEKADSIMRSRPEWFREVGILILDEIHLIGSDRGPVYEIIATKLRTMYPDIRVIGLSATIGNSEELATWLSAKLVSSSWRPVELVEEVLVSDGFDTILEQVRKALSSGGQVLVFVNSRRSAESVAEKIGEALRFRDTGLEELSGELSSALSSPTRQCKRLAGCVKNGTAFHHAGLVNRQRTRIEDAFREGKIKVIAATPTLCLGENSSVWSGVGEVPVKSLKPGGKIFGLSNSELRHIPIDDVIELPSPSELVEITSSNYGPIIITKNHRILLKYDKKEILMDASKCKVGDAIATIGRLRIERPRLNRWGDFVKDNKLPFNDSELDESIYYLIGVFLGDGYSGAEIHNGEIKYKGSLSIVNEDQEVFDKIIKSCRKYGLNFKINKNSYGNSQIVLTKAKWFREFLVRCGVDLGSRKHIDKKLMNASDDKLAFLLKGLFDTDGCMEKRGRISFLNTSEGLIKDLRKSLLRYGIVTWVKERKGQPVLMHDKTYHSTNSRELYIQSRRGILDFYEHIGFKIKRKQDILESVVRSYEITRVTCRNCKYTLHPNLFKGRTRRQKEWGNQKKAVIMLLGETGEVTSRELVRILGYEPKGKESRVNLHYALIKKRKFGSNEWFWSLNDIGCWIYEKLLKKNIDVAEYFTENDSCPLCNSKLESKVRGTWRTNAFEGDIFWDIIKKVRIVKNNAKKVYDVVLPDDGSNDHLFVADGFIVHNSAGLNLPSRTVLIRDLKRYSMDGQDYIPVFEYKQQAGRAGRPKYDNIGYAISLAKTESEAEFAYEHYICGEPEPIHSRLGVEPVLRFHVLAQVASNFTRTQNALSEFFRQTFYGFQYGIHSDFEATLKRMVVDLAEWGFVEEKDRFIVPTPLGTRVSELYIDPLTAHTYLDFFAKTEKSGRFPAIGLLEVLSDATEMPHLPVKTSEESALWAQAYDAESEFVRDIGGLDLDWKFLHRFKTAKMFTDWMNELSEDAILEHYNVAPGQLNQRQQIMEWLTYAACELCRIRKLKASLVELKKLETRVKYGIREELIPLVSVKGVGRVRARKLFDAGFKKPEDFRKMGKTKLSKIIGEKTAENLLNGL